MSAPPARVTVPARAVLAAAEARAERDGHENLGFLSAAHGFLPQEPPRLALPDSHGAWDAVAARLPELFRTLGVRAALEALPVLPATPEALPDDALLRAAVILGIAAHAHFYADPEPPAGVPAGIAEPWRVVSDRLGRPAPNLSFIDLNAYNWRRRPGRTGEGMAVEDLALLVPILGNRDERRFQMTPVAMLAAFTPVVGAAVRAQEAVVRDDARALRRELAGITDVVAELARIFAGVDPNPHSPGYVNPVVWGKTVAPLATPFQAVDPPPGPSGTAIPAFQLLDILLGRRAHATTIGRETALARTWFPPHWRAFLDAAEAVDVATHIATRRDRALRGVFAEAVEAYAGDDGLLGRHRLKTFGFLDLSFKAGRSKTLGGFAGSFEDRPWDRMDAELGLARLERTPRPTSPLHDAQVIRSDPVGADGDAVVARVVLDLAGAGVRHRPGARLAVLPEQPPDLVDRTLAALRARGDEPIPLDGAWQAALAGRGAAGTRVLPLRALLVAGRLRPVGRDVAKALHAMTRNPTLHAVIEARAEDQWALWQVLELLAEESGLRPAALWKAHPGEPGTICALVPPELPRLYSIASAMPPGASEVAEVRLTVAALAYRTEGGTVAPTGEQRGTASAHLTTGASPGTGVRVRVVEPAAFALPQDPATPVVMVAGGTGVSPFLGMLAARAAQPGTGPATLLLGTRTRAAVHGADEIADHVAAGRLRLRVLLSREDARARSEGGVVLWSAGPRGRIGDLLREPAEAARLRDLLRPTAAGGPGGHVYVCGRTGFASAVEAALEDVLAGVGPGGGWDAIVRLNGEGRYHREVFTTYPGAHFAGGRRIDASEVVVRNDPSDALWTVIAGRVYDLTRFAQLHPGGDKIIRSYAGLDATAAYRRVGHDAHPEVDALLGLYELGRVRRLHLGSAWGVAVTPEGLRVVTAADVYRGWIRLLYRVVEVENAVANDYGIRAEPVTHDESPDAVAMSPYKARLLLETHRRLAAEHLPGLTGRRAEDLWAVTSGLVGDRHDVRWMAEALRAASEGPAAQGAAAVRAETAAAFRALAADGDADRLARCAVRTAALEAEDRRVLAGLKAVLRDGVRVFEQHEQASAQTGAEALLAAATAVPSVVAAHHERVAALAGGG